MSGTDTILELINRVWKYHPSMRFFQLMDWLKHEYSMRNNGFGRREGYENLARGDKHPLIFVDLYYLEDKQFEVFLRNLISKEEEENV